MSFSINERVCLTKAGRREFPRLKDGAATVAGITDMGLLVVTFDGTVAKEIWSPVWFTRATAKQSA